MRIGINTLACLPGRSGGDGRYVRELVRRLVALDRENQYFLFVAPWNETWFRFSEANVRRVMCPTPSPFSLRVLWEQAVLPIAVGRLRLDVFHAPVNVAPLALSCPIVLTILEAEPFMFPKTIPFPLLVYWRVMRRASARKARRLIAISESSKQEIVRYMGVSPQKLKVVQLGVDSTQFRQLAIESADQLPHGVRPPYFFWTGRSYPRKNLARLLDAFGLFAAETTLPHQLVLAGVDGWGEGEAKQAMARLGDLQARVVSLGHISDMELKVLYQQADAFVFPSLHEAFGLPVLEAMASGTPVITSATTATAEVAGDAAVLVDPTSIEDIARGMKKVGSDQDVRERLREKGFVRAQSFSWRETAEQSLLLYIEVAAEGD